MKVYVKGIGGLGNILFQISTAIYYAEKYGMNVNIVLSDVIKFGTSNMFGRCKCKNSYDTTIFKNFKIADTIDKCITVHNDYTDTKIDPVDNILISGYCQNINLFKDIFNKIPTYLSFNIVPDKYGDLSNALCIGVRVGSDFCHMKKITENSYIRAIEFLKTQNHIFDKIIILGDVDTYWTNTSYTVIHANEDDITQFSIGLKCKYYILSESTFHLWIAYLGTQSKDDKKVVCFNNTDITNRNLHLESWYRLNY